MEADSMREGEKILLKNITNRSGLFPTRTVALSRTVAVRRPHKPNRGVAVRFVGRTELWGLRTVRRSNRGQH